MSATPMGPGWWQASDGQWYPPPPPQQPQFPQQPPEPTNNERTPAQSVRNGVILLVVMVVAAVGLGWTARELTKNASDDPLLSPASQRSAVSACKIEKRTLDTVIAAAKAQGTPEDWQSFIDPGATFRYWKIVDLQVIPLGDLPAGCI